jgi:hypothetical protein
MSISPEIWQNRSRSNKSNTEIKMIRGFLCKLGSLGS